MMRCLLLALIVALAPSYARASEPMPITLTELAQAYSADIGRLHVELRAALIREAKLQAELEKCKEVTQPKEPEKK